MSLRRIITALTATTFALIPAVALATPAHAQLGSSMTSSAADGSSFEFHVPAEETPVEASFDLQAHRGGRGEWTEESATAFQESLKLDVTTLELDIVLSEDNKPVVWHDPSIQADKCSDTQPATPNDPEFPYVGKLVHELNWDQLQTLNCDKVLSGFPDAQPVEGNKLLQLQNVFDIAQADPEVRFNIETKIEAEKREDSATPEEFVNTIVPIIEANDAVERSTIQSFDWRSLPLVAAANPAIGIVALYDETTWVPNSVWTEPVSFDAVGGDILAAGRQIGANVLSPAFKLVTAENVRAAQEAGFKVIPWTVNEPADLEKIIDTGVDGLITDYPTRAKQILERKSIEVA